MFDTSVFLHALPQILLSARMTVLVSASGLIAGFVIAVGVVLACLSSSALWRRVGSFYTFVFRGIPLLVQLMAVYYFLPLALGLDVPAVASAITAIALCEGAYIGEILRGGFLGIPRGQIEATQVLGLSRFSTLLHIEIPQAIRLTTPALVNEVILLVKASSLISVVGVAEITRTSQNIAGSTFRPLEAYLAAGVAYFILNGALSLVGRWAEVRLRVA